MKDEELIKEIKLQIESLQEEIKAKRMVLESLLKQYDELNEKDS